MLRNPNRDEVDRIIKAGERSCWPHIGRIRTMCRVEFALERAVRYLRGEQAIEDEKRHGRSAIGRVPSFYTSPSSMNLSSLDQVARSSPASPPKISRSVSKDGAGTPSSNTSNTNNNNSNGDGGMRRNKSINVAGAVMTMETAAKFGRFTHMDDT